MIITFPVVSSVVKPRFSLEVHEFQSVSWAGGTYLKLYLW
jgi:hypothetical protein